jgi:hypothetical protein
MIAQAHATSAPKWFKFGHLNLECSQKSVQQAIAKM